MGVPAHQATTRHLGAAYPFVTETGLGTEGVLIGRDLFGGPFVFDPFVLYQRGELTNPNMAVFGQIGRGKSAFIKSYLWRQVVFGRRAWVIDPKGEYGTLARACGCTPISLRPGGGTRLNPLDGPGGDPEDVDRRRAELTCALVAASLGRPLAPNERTAVELAVAAVGARSRSAAPALPAVVDALLDPEPHSARAVRTDRAGLAADGRLVALELRRLVAGDLAGMFDGETTPGIGLGGPVVVLDMSALYDSPALAVLMTCAASWLQAALRAGGAGGPVVLVVDEAWAVLSNAGVARWLQSSWKLSRAWGVSNVAVLHRVSDLGAAGSSGSEEVALAQGLLADSETRVVYGQAPGELDQAAPLLGLSSTEAVLVPHLARGVALWKVGMRSFLVQHRLSPLERHLVDTDAAMAVGSP